MNDMKLREEYRNEPPPDDPIEFHLWVEANECRECRGTGIDWTVFADGGVEPELLDDYGDEDDLPDCPDCDGSGYTEAARPYV
jgi:hypothetical protein